MFSSPYQLDNILLEKSAQVKVSEGIQLKAKQTEHGDISEKSYIILFTRSERVNDTR